MDKNKVVWLVIGVVVVVVIVVFGMKQPSGNAPQGGAVKIGVILPQTGDLSVTGEKMYNGVRLAAAQAPANMQFVYEDDHSDVTTGVTAANKLLSVDKVDLLVGLYNPDEVKAVDPIAQAAGKEIFTTNFCDSSFKPLMNVFCGYPGAKDQLATAIPMIQKKNLKKFALVDSNSSFGIDSRDAMKAIAEQLGAKVVLNDFLPTSPTRDYHTEALKVMQSGADAIFTATDDPADGLALVKDLYNLGFKGTRITFVDTDDKYLSQFGASAEGTFAPGITPSNFAPDFTAAYQAKYNVAPDYAGALGYDFIRSLAGALAANNWNVGTIASSVVAYSYADPAITNFHFLPDRTVTYQLELWEAVNGHYEKAPGY
jgi:ABC-type branched-subunit amino acid transport system substrate-binding protein